MINFFKKNKDAFRKIVKSIFIIYLFLLLFVLVFKFPTRLALDAFIRWSEGGGIVRAEAQLVPFKTITFYVSHAKVITDWFFQNLLCNIIIFVPYGFLVPILLEEKSRKFLQTLLSGMVVIVGIEVTQYLFGIGLCDIDDLILNTISILIGYGCYKIGRKMVNYRSENQ